MSKEFIEWSYSNDNYDWCCLAHAKAAWDYQQAKIDALMLEYCPEEMTEDQLERWKKHQRVFKELNMNLKDEI